MEKRRNDRLQRNQEAKRNRQDDGMLKRPISLELECSRISAWENINVVPHTDPRQINHWGNQTTQASKRTVLLENGTFSKPYYAIHTSGVPEHVHQERKKNAAIKKRENGYKQSPSHPIEGSAIRAFLELKNKSSVLTELFDQLEFQPVFDGLYADVMVKLKHQVRWTMLQFKSATWKKGVTVTYLRNKTKYDERIYVICVGISNINHAEKITSVDQLNSSTFHEVFFLGDCSDIKTFSPTCGSMNKKFEHCRYTEDQNIEKLEHLFAEFVRYVENDHPMYTWDEVMYDYTNMTKQYMIEKSGFRSLENAGLSLTAPWRQNETVDIVVDGRINISMKTAYKSSKSAFSFTIKGSINVDLCDYVFAITPLGIVIFTCEEVYKGNKRTSFCWKIDSKPIISLDCVRDVSSELPIRRREHLCIE
jgi:hypothetical protein